MSELNRRMSKRVSDVRRTRNLPQLRGVPPEGGKMRGRNLATGAAAAALAVGAYAVGVNQSAPPATAQNGTQVNLWKTYTDVLTKARYIDLTHTITPNMPVWKGFGPATFEPTVNPATGKPYTYAKRRLRGDALHDRDRPVRHAARPARALGARVPGDRRAAGDVRGPAAGRDLDRRRRSRRRPTTTCRSRTSRRGRRSTAGSRRARS